MKALKHRFSNIRHALQELTENLKDVIVFVMPGSTLTALQLLKHSLIIKVGISKLGENNLLRINLFHCGY